MTVQHNNNGTKVRITILDENGLPMDLSLATLKELIFLKPDKTLLTAAASFTTDGTDGKLESLVDPDQTGHWAVQSHSVIGGSDWYSSRETFQVSQNIKGV